MNEWRKEQMNEWVNGWITNEYYNLLIKSINQLINHHNEKERLVLTDYNFLLYINNFLELPTLAGK